MDFGAAWSRMVHHQPVRIKDWPSGDHLVMDDSVRCFRYYHGDIRDNPGRVICLTNDQIFSFEWEEFGG